MATGKRTQAYTSAIGWCLLGALSEDELCSFAANQDFVRFTDHTPMSPDELYQIVVQTREAGSVISQGFRNPGGSSVAVPVRDNTGAIVACVNLLGPDSSFDFDRMDSFYLLETKAAALRISRQLGCWGD